MQPGRRELQLRTLATAFPAAILTTFVVLCGWAAFAQQQWLTRLEHLLEDAPQSASMTHKLADLLPLLEPLNDGPRDPATARRTAEEHRDRVAQAVVMLRTEVDDQHQRWQRLLAATSRKEIAENVAAFQTLRDGLAALSDHAALAAAPPPPPPGVAESAAAGSAAGAVAASPTDASRRAETLRAFRFKVHTMLEVVSSLDSSPWMGRVVDDARRHGRRWLRSCLAAMACSLAGLLWLARRLQAQLWGPLRGLSRSLQDAACGEYAAAAPSGCGELRMMAAALETVQARCAAADRDRAQEVADRAAQKVRSERLAGIGLLATGVAHEINNPLTAISGAAEGLRYRLPELAERLPTADAQVFREYLQMIQDEAKRCRGITSKLLDFARGREGERGLYDVTAIVHEVVEMFRHVREYASRTIEISRRDPCRAYCNGPEIKQVILNLVVNALQATSPGGRLEIRIDSDPDHVEIEFQDTGAGMSADTLVHVFDPFFSTKGPGQGTGLGLSISHAIVEKHGGSLEARSPGPGQGSTFSLRLPATESAARASRAA